MTHPAGTAAPAAAPERYTLRIPDSWWHLELGSSSLDVTIRRLIEAQAYGNEAVGREELDALVRTTRKIAREAAARGALQAAGMVQFTDSGSSLSATTVVLRVNTPEDSSADLAELMIPVAMKNANNPLGRGTEANTAAVIDLPGVGPAGRVTVIEDLDYSGRGTVRTAIMHTVVPLPNTRDFLVISSATPNLSLLTEFFDVFDAISGTLRFPS
ncbi:hypothetical protein ACIQU4_07960 [Streptomyces sp. NPDC090741]|uniref:hypothetical protein n=1 Tax=Streptomyces sp. NPDC090741 TaxID=3365967 RepID=UPI0037FD435C